MIGKAKGDFVGKRSLTLPDLARAGRKQLVGLLTEDPSVVLEEGAQVTENAAPPPGSTALGHVTSSYRSETLRRSIALALVAGGRSRIGARLYASTPGAAVPVRVARPVLLRSGRERACMSSAFEAIPGSRPALRSTTRRCRRGRASPCSTRRRPSVSCFAAARRRERPVPPAFGVALPARLGPAGRGRRAGGAVARPRRMAPDQRGPVGRGCVRGARSRARRRAPQPGRRVPPSGWASSRRGSGGASARRRLSARPEDESFSGRHGDADAVRPGGDRAVASGGDRVPGRGRPLALPLARRRADRSGARHAGILRRSPLARLSSERP